MTGFHYVYMLSDVATHTHHYVGMTEDLKARLEKHNSGQVPHTSKFAPWIVDAAIAVRNKRVAAHLEQYFKSGAGRAFANRHLFLLVGKYEISYNVRHDKREPNMSGPYYKLENEKGSVDAK